MKSINKILDKLTEFLKTYQNSLYQLKILSNEYILSLKQAVDIYIKESKKMLKIDDNIIEQEDQIEINGQVFVKPFVEKPINADDHNIFIYFPSSAGGGSQRLFRKVSFSFLNF